MKPSALCALLFFVFSIFCQAAEPSNSSALKNAKLEYLKSLQSALAAANQENHSDEAKRITEEINKVLAELDGMKAPAPANAPSAQAAKSSPAPNAAAMKPGKIRVIEVNGSGAKSINAQGATSELKRGDFLSQGVRVVTGQNASVELAFENGSSVVVKPGSEFSIDQFLADPFDSQEVDYGSLENEPTMSVTRTNLKSGEIFFHVEKLKERSTYEIITPVGIAGIRGTGGFVRSGKGKGAFGLYEGSAIFKTPNGQVHSVRQGQAIAVGDAATQYAVTGNPPKSAEILSSAKEKMGEVEEKTPAQPFEDEPLPEKEEKKADASEDSASADEYEGPVVTTLAGSGSPGFADGAGKEASFNNPSAVVVDGSGNVYVGDGDNHRIRKITQGGLVSTVAGNGNPSKRKSKAIKGETVGTKVTFDKPRGIAVDKGGNIYVADKENHAIRKITPDGVIITLTGSGKPDFADGEGLAARFNRPHGVAVDESGNIYVADSNNNRIRKITASGNVTTFAGSGIEGHADGLGKEASFNHPHSVAIDGSGNVYVSDRFNHSIRKISPSGTVTTLAGSGKPEFADGQGKEASFKQPCGIAVDEIGTVYVADTYNHRIRKIGPSGYVTTLVGSGNPGSEDGYGSAASFNKPYAIAVDAGGAVYVADQLNHKIRKIYQY
jgi:sugar lactone lactonase YvrE